MGSGLNSLLENTKMHLSASLYFLLWSSVTGFDLV